MVAIKVLAAATLMASAHGQNGLRGLAQDDDGWNWATTTYFDGEPVWPNGLTTKNLNLNKITAAPDAFGGQVETRFGLNAIRGGRMGAAIPWVQMISEFGGRSQVVDNILESAAGSSSVNQCFLVQPINTPPNGFQVADIQDESSVVPTGMDGNRYVYLIVPYQGCGGDSNAPGNDVFNSCYSSIASALDQIGFVEGDTTAWNNVCTSPTDACASMCSLWENGKLTAPVPDSASADTFVKDGSCAIGVSKLSNYGMDTKAAIQHYVDAGLIPADSHCGTYINWCSGANMHMDAAIDSPFWHQHYSASSLVGLNGDTGGTNIFIRYKAVPCNIWGDFDPSN